MSNFGENRLDARYIQSERSNCWPREDRKESWGTINLDGWEKWKSERITDRRSINFGTLTIVDHAKHIDVYRHRILFNSDYDWLMDNMTVRNTVDYRIATHLMLKTDTVGYVFRQLKKEGFTICNKESAMNTSAEYVWLEVTGCYELTVVNTPEPFNNYNQDFIHNMVSYNLGCHTMEFYQAKLSKEKNRWVSRDDLRAETKKLMNQLNGVQDACTFLACMDQYRFTNFNTLLILFRR